MAEEAVAELEAMRKDDGSWHPCRVSLRPSTTSTTSNIIVDFGDFSSEDVISSKEEALKCLRYSSTFLQDGECANIDEGERVLAMNKLHSQSLFFDAIVEKVLRVRHSKRVYCRCTFEVKWINSKGNWDVMTLSSGAIKKLSRKSIASHPVIAEFLNFMTPLNSNVPSDLSLFEETKNETDIQGLLESQIEKISAIPADIEDSEEMVLRGAKASDEVAKCTRSNVINNDYRHNNGVQKKRQFEEVEKNSEDKPFLSPLAARAALASLVHELPQKSEIFGCHMGEEYSHMPFVNSANHTDSPSFNISCSFGECNVPIHRSLPGIQEFGRQIQNDHLCESNHECKSFINNKGEKKHRGRKESSNMLSRKIHFNMAEKSYNMKLDNEKHSARSATKASSKYVSSAMRETRSMSKRTNQKLTEENEKIHSKKNQKVAVDKQEVRPSTKQRQNSPSLSQNRQRPEENKMSPELALISFKEGFETQEYVGGKKSVTSPISKKRQRLSGSTSSYEIDEDEISAGSKIPVQKKHIPSRPGRQITHRPCTRSQR